MKSSEQTLSSPPPNHHLWEVIRLFLRLGFTAFGGPAAHIAMMRDEVVRRRQWITNERFADLIGIANLIPGPSSTQIAIYLGYLRAGWPGLLAAGLCFICPAMLIVLVLAWAYMTYGALPQINWLFYGIQPVVVAIVTHALWTLGRTVFKTIWALLIAVLFLAAYLVGINVLIILFGGAILYAVLAWFARRQRRKSDTPTMSIVLPFTLGKLFFPSISLGLLATGTAISLPLLFLVFLKLGAVVYGSGYTLLAFLQVDLVDNLHWLTDNQLLTAISIGQFTPGPVFTTATFIGYILAGWPGALIATLGIFLPSFCFIPLIHPLAIRLRKFPLTALLLDGVNIAALALIAGVLIDLGRHALTDLLTWAIAIVSLLILLRFKLNSIWLLCAGALIGVLRFLLFQV